MERVEQRYHFWPGSLWNTCCAPSTIKPKRFTGHQQRQQQQRGRVKVLQQLAELPSEGQTYSTHLEIPDKLKFTPSRLLEPTWWPSRCTYIWVSVMALEDFHSLAGAERRHFSPIQLPFPPAHLFWSGSFQLSVGETSTLTRGTRTDSKMLW